MSSIATLESPAHVTRPTSTSSRCIRGYYHCPRSTRIVIVLLINASLIIAAFQRNDSLTTLFVRALSSLVSPFLRFPTVFPPFFHGGAETQLTLGTMLTNAYR